MKPIDFIRIAVKDYKKVGAISISSRHTIKRVIKGLKPGSRFVVEYGAGNGVITEEILKALPSDGKLIAIELNEQLLKELSVISDKRLEVIHGNVLEISDDFSKLGLPRIDAVISSMPMSLLSKTDRKKIIENTQNGLAAGGRFIICQYSLIILSDLKKKFKKINYSLELRNLPPYFVIIAEKQDTKN